MEILKEKKSKEKVIGRKFEFSSKEPNGVSVIRLIVKEAKSNIDAEIIYTAAGKYTIKIKSRDPRKADQQITEILNKIESLSKQKGCTYSLGEYIN